MSCPTCGAAVATIWEQRPDPNGPGTTKTSQQWCVACGWRSEKVPVSPEAIAASEAAVDAGSFVGSGRGALRLSDLPTKVRRKALQALRGR